MKNSNFRFKQFSIEQSNSAMKIGTDGVLLGAWSPIAQNINSVLDIGSGTGLIALMLAQRTVDSKITAVEIEAAAAKEATFNFNNSPWSNRLNLVHTSIIDFCLNCNETYDLIVSNPPFFKNPYKLSKDSRSTARDNFHLSYENLFSSVNQLICSEGDFVLIAPFEYRSALIKLGDQNDLYLNQELLVKGSFTSPYKRILMHFSRYKTPLKTGSLVLEESRNNRTKDHQELVEDFYL